MGNHQDDDETPLLQRLGGASGIRGTISGTYQRILADDKLKPFFEGMSMPALRAHQHRFFTAAFSGMPGGGGADLDAASLILERHRHLFEKGGLDETHFDRFLGHIVDAMVAQELPQDAINEAVTVLKPLRATFEKGARKYGKAGKEKRMPAHDRGSRSSIRGQSSVCSKSTKSTMKTSDSRSKAAGSVCSKSSKSTLRQLDGMTVRERRLAAFLGEDDDQADCAAPPPIKIQFKRST
jgi:hemoglobin